MALRTGHALGVLQHALRQVPQLHSHIPSLLLILVPAVPLLHLLLPLWLPQSGSHAGVYFHVLEYVLLLTEI